MKEKHKKIVNLLNQNLLTPYVFRQLSQKSFDLKNFPIRNTYTTHTESTHILDLLSIYPHLDLLTIAFHPMIISIIHVRIIVPIKDTLMTFLSKSIFCSFFYISLFQRSKMFHFISFYFILILFCYYFFSSEVSICVCCFHMSVFISLERPIEVM